MFGKLRNFFNTPETNAREPKKEPGESEIDKMMGKKEADMGQGVVADNSVEIPTYGIQGSGKKETQNREDIEEAIRVGRGK